MNYHYSIHVYIKKVSKIYSSNSIMNFSQSLRQAYLCGSEGVK